VIWQVSTFDSNHNGRIEKNERIYSSHSTVAVSEGLVFLPDVEGYLHCFDASMGAHRWTYDLESEVHGSPLVVAGKVYVGDSLRPFASSRQDLRIGVAKRLQEVAFSGKVERDV